MALIVMPSLLSKRPWARIRARCKASFFIVLSKSVRCCSVRGRTYLTLIALKIGVTCHIALELSWEILYQNTLGRALTIETCPARGHPDGRQTPLLCLLDKCEYLRGLIPTDSDAKQSVWHTLSSSLRSHSHVCRVRMTLKPHSCLQTSFPYSAP